MRQSPVEALGHILSYSDAARHALEDLLQAGGAEIGSISEIQTQVSGEDGATPDLSGYDEQVVERLLIEAKFWAGLTENQPNSYLARLLKVEEGQTVLLFLVPAARLRTLWREVRELAAEMHEIVPHLETEHLRSAAISNRKCWLMMTSWRSLLAGMATQADLDRDQRAQSDIGQLRGLSEQMDGDEFVPFEPGELGPNVARRMLDLYRLVDDAVERTVASGWVRTDGLYRTPPSGGGYGRYMRLGGAVVWFGIYLRRWAEHSNSPIWLWPSSGDIRLALRSRFDHSPDGNHFPIDLPTGVEHAAVLDAVVKQLEHIGRLIEPEDLDA